MSISPERARAPLRVTLTLALAAIAIWPRSGRAVTYYVRQTVGDDAHNGTSPTTAWQIHRENRRAPYEWHRIGLTRRVFVQAFLLEQFADAGRAGFRSDNAGAADLETLRTLHHTIDADTALAGLPTRVAHNDAKAANVLVGSTTVVVDLDTVMPGGVLWDLGDMVRSSTGTSDEATATVTFDAARHRTLVDAWLGEVDDLLTEAERAAVPHAGAVVTFEQAVRFLTDHINGDVYFRVTRSGQNLERARNQLQLLRSMVSTP